MKNKHINIFILYVVALLAATSVYSQTTTTQKDSISKDSIPILKYKFNPNQKGSLFLNTPSTYSVVFDKKLNKYIVV